MGNGPKISIITACYNAEKTIEQTIQSVINQTYDNIEYIVLDGASTDSTMDIVSKYKDQIDLIISEPDKGVYDAFNKGWKLATGDYIHYLNADDFFIEDDIISQVAQELNNEVEIKLLYGQVKAFDEKTNNWYILGSEVSLDGLAKDHFFAHQSVFVQRSLFEEFNGFDLYLKNLADLDFLIKCYKKYGESSLFLRKKVAMFRLGGISNKIENLNTSLTEEIAIRSKHFHKIDERMLQQLEGLEYLYIREMQQKFIEGLLLGTVQNDINKDVVIFGTRKMATLIYLYLKNNHVHIKYFLDNNKEMQGELLHDLVISSPEALKNEQNTCVIITIERPNVAKEIKRELQNIYPSLDVLIWYELF